MDRQELIEQAKARGFRLSGRTLRYWQKSGLLPKPRFIWDGGGKGRADYDPQTLDIACFLSELKGKSLMEKRKELDDLKELYYLPGYGLVKVEEIVQQVRDGQIYAYRKLMNGDIVLTIKRREVG